MEPIMLTIIVMHTVWAWVRMQAELAERRQRAEYEKKTYCQHVLTIIQKGRSK